MNVFVLSTGRCGSLTVARAFGHATNYTAGHETRAGVLPDRFTYPDDHIESDNRLSWFLGSLDLRYGDRAHWVHLTRPSAEVVASYHRRWEDHIARDRPASLLVHPGRLYSRVRRWWREPTSVHGVAIGPAFAYGLVMARTPLDRDARRAAVELYVATVNEQIEHFLAGRPNVSRIALPDGEDGFREAWQAIGAEGPLDAALRTLRKRHNATPADRTLRSGS